MTNGGIRHEGWAVFPAAGPAGSTEKRRRFRAHTGVLRVSGMLLQQTNPGGPLGMWEKWGDSFVPTRWTKE